MAAPLMLRGRIYLTAPNAGYTPYLVVSNNPRNLRLRHVLAVRLTAEPGPQTPTVVALPEGEPFVGRALCDDIDRVATELLDSDLGALSAPTMRRIDTALRAVLAL